MRKAVLLDWDDLLVDTSEYWHKANAHILSRYGRQVDSDAFFGRHHSGVCPEKFLAEIDLAIDSGQFQRDRNNYYDTIIGDLGWNPGAEELLDALQARGLRIAAVSHILRQNVEQLTHLRFDRYFPDPLFLTQEDLVENGKKKKKPHPYGLREACKRLRVNPGKACMIGDYRSDQKAAMRAGMPGILIPSRVTHDDAADFATYQYQDLRECLEKIDEWLQ